MKQRLIITVGLPGSGKSTYLASLGTNPVSSDDVRRLIADNPAIQTIHRRVFATVRYLIRQRFATGCPSTYVDATNLTPWERRAYIRLAQLHDADPEALFFDVPLEVCLHRNHTRSRIVPEDALREMSSRLIAPTLHEGFTRVTIVR